MQLPRRLLAGSFLSNELSLPSRLLITDSSTHSKGAVVFYTVASVCLTIFAGLMSGLTLGLMSMDKVDLEVLKRSGTATEKKYAARIMPVVSKPHLLLVTLLLCNAIAMEALPLFIDRLLTPVSAIIISVSAVLMFGEVIPQAVCSRYGLAVGAFSAYFVRILMFLCWPVAYPISRVLDAVLGHQETALFRRGQLKALVDIHSAQNNMGGDLTADETSVIRGALDLASKIARSECTPLDKVFMLSADTVLDEETLMKVLRLGHSRVPVHQPGNRQSILGILLVKELVLLDPSMKVRVDTLHIRPAPFLSSDTPMWALLKIFKSGRSHMVMLTKPHQHPRNGLPPGEPELQVMTSPAKEQPMHRDSSINVTLDEQINQAPQPSSFEDESDVGEVIGLITIEDVVETLIGTEILDETDRFVDNERTQRVEHRYLPERLQRDFGPDGDQETPRLRSQSVEGRTTDDMYPPLLRGAFSDGGASGSSSPRSNTSIY